MLGEIVFKFSAAQGLIKYFFYKLIYGNRLLWYGVPRLLKGSRIRLRKGGRITLGKCAHLGDGTLVRVTQNAEFKMGENSGFNSYCVVTCRDKIDIGNNVIFGPFVTIHDHDHIFGTEKNINEEGYTTSPIVIEDNVWVGANVTILKGVHIGKGAVIAAGTLINKDIPPHTLVYNKRDYNYKLL